MKVIVIGSVSSGISVAEQLAAGDPEVEIVLYERASCCSCGAHGLPHYLGSDKDALETALAGCERSARGVSIRVGREVTAVDTAARQVSVRELETGMCTADSYDVLVLATGSRNSPLRVDGAGRMGVHALRRVDDLLLLREFLRTPYVRDIVVLGGGLSALEVAGAFLQRGRNVRVIDGGKGLLPGFDGEVRARVQRELEEQGIQFSLGERVTAIHGRTFVETVQTDRNTYPCDLCVPALEDVPNTELLPAAERTSDGRLLVDETWRTSLPHVYAAGSCAARRGEGAPTVSIKAAALEIARTGLTEEAAAHSGLTPGSATATGMDRTGVSPHTGSVTVKLVYDRPTRRVLGAQIWGGADSAARINAVAVAVQAGMTVEELGKTRFVSSTPSGAPWDPLHLACAAARD